MKLIQKTALLISLLILSPLVLATTLPGPLVDTAWLRAHHNDVTILDIRLNAKSFVGKPAYSKDKKTGKLKLVKIAGHIPGAHLVDYKHLRGDQMINGQKITKMLLDKATFEKLMQSAGVNKGDAIVIVSKGASNLDVTGATRLYWSLKYYGQDNMAILDGGLAQWLKDGGKVSNTAMKVKKGNWVATAERKDILATSADVKNAMHDKSAQLVDTRPVSQYMGVYRKSYVFAEGHIPGAKNLPNELLTGPNGKAEFTPKEKLQKITASLGIKPEGKIITYCNSGHLASGSWFFYHEIMGNKQAKLYDGSMHEWTKEKGDTVSLRSE
jgi:thiosulfate/3-mercaptopyruvate sulfurtransferase